VAFTEGRGNDRNREILDDLQELLSLESYPRRIECFDISNIQGTRAVASGVTFIDGEPAKSAYRKFRIRTVEGADDYAMMREVLERRVSRGMKEGDLPDLLVVDGGRGQLNVACEVIERLGAEVEVVGVAKVRDEETGRKIRGQERIYLRDLPEPLFLEGQSQALYLLERVRDEAHRFANTYHRQLRTKAIGESRLDGVPGIGTVLKRRLLQEFGSLERLRRAVDATLPQCRNVAAPRSGLEGRPRLVRLRRCASSAYAPLWVCRRRRALHPDRRAPARIDFSGFAPYDPIGLTGGCRVGPSPP
jgi:excinuclease ABC subunit C